MIQDSPTRALLLTPPGAGAIAVVRLAGPSAVRIASSVFQSRGRRALADSCDQLVYGSFLVDGQAIDDVIASFPGALPCPAVDFCTHGGIRVVECILTELSRCGAVMSVHGDVMTPLWPTDDLIQYEAANAMASARTERGVRFLARQYVELPKAFCLAAAACTSDLPKAERLLQRAASGYQTARMLLKGVVVAIVGPPNAGKSTVFNRLMGRHAAVVSPISGTTRDWVSGTVELDGIPITLIDTAGVHNATGQLESKAIAAGDHRIAEADLRLIVLDGSRTTEEFTATAIESWRAMGPSIIAVNKCDADLPGARGTISDHPAVIHRISAKTDRGFDELRDWLLGTLGVDRDIESSTTVFTRRQFKLIGKILGTIHNSPEGALQALRTDLLGGPGGEWSSRIVAE